MGDSSVSGTCFSCRLDMKNPHTSCGGFERMGRESVSGRLDLNNPHTSCGGFEVHGWVLFGRLDLKHPDTSCGGFKKWLGVGSVGRI